MNDPGARTTIAVTVMDAPMIAGHLALDLLNTRFRLGTELVDALQSDQDVLQWLERVGWPVERSSGATRSRGLLRAARALRESVRETLTAWKTGKRPDVTKLNAFLAASRSCLQLSLLPRGKLQLVRQWARETPEQMLAPVAEAAAELFTGDDVSLIRGCEDAECVLWFLDQTKSHRRRWCSTATCGNRHKVNAYRERQRVSGAS